MGLKKESGNWPCPEASYPRITIGSGDMYRVETWLPAVLRDWNECYLHQKMERIGCLAPQTGFEAVLHGIV
jgi:hypothetical protein